MRHGTGMCLGHDRGSWGGGALYKVLQEVKSCSEESWRAMRSFDITDIQGGEVWYNKINTVKQIKT